jgi:hypothetical protein
MRVGILGSGLMGAKLGTIFTRAGLGGPRQSENRLRADCCQFGLESDLRHKPWSSSAERQPSPPFLPLPPPHGASLSPLKFPKNPRKLIR